MDKLQWKAIQQYIDLAVSEGIVSMDVQMGETMGGGLSLQETLRVQRENLAGIRKNLERLRVAVAADLPERVSTAPVIPE